MVDFVNATLTSDGSKECVNTTGTVEVYEKNPVYECVHKGQLFSKFFFFIWKITTNLKKKKSFGSTEVITV